MSSFYMLPPADGSNSKVSFLGRTYATSVNVPILVPVFDIPQLETLGWRKSNSAISPASTPIATVNPLLVCSNRGNIPNNAANISNAAHVKAESRKLITIGGSAQSELRLSYCNFYMLNGNGSEQVTAVSGGNAVYPINLFVAVEINGVTQQVTWSNAYSSTQGPYGPTTLNGTEITSTFYLSQPAGIGASTSYALGAATNPCGLSKGIVLAAGATDVVCDPIYPWQFGLTSFTPGLQIYIREMRVLSTPTVYASLTSAPALCSFGPSVETGEGTYYSDPTVVTTSQLLSTGAMSIQSGGTGSGQCGYGPTSVIGRAVGTPDIAVLILGDSLLNGTGDVYANAAGDVSIANPAGITAWASGQNYPVGWQVNNAGNFYKCTTAITTSATAPTGTTTSIDGSGVWTYVSTTPAYTMPSGGQGLNSGGYVQRGLYQLAGRNVPTTKHSVGGALLLNVYKTHLLRRYYWKYHTHVICDFGTNDGASGYTAASVFNELQTLFTSLKSGDSNVRHIAMISIVNRCNTTDQGQTNTNQTPIANFGLTGSFQYPLNNLVKGAVGNGLIDEYIDVTPVCSDAQYTDRWPATISVDGVHPYGNTIQTALAGIIAAHAILWS